jgi:hypothetical protein
MMSPVTRCSFRPSSEHCRAIVSIHQCSRQGDRNRTSIGYLPSGMGNARDRLGMAHHTPAELREWIPGPVIQPHRGVHGISGLVPNSSSIQAIYGTATLHSPIVG